MLHKFYFDAQTRARTHRERYGQAMFNHLVSVRPDLAEQIRGTDKDPFHVERLAHPNWDRFVKWLEAEWSKKPQPINNAADAAARERNADPTVTPCGMA